MELNNSIFNTNILYPNIDDNDFNFKISNKKEFIDSFNKKPQETKNILNKNENTIFTLKSHQLFVKNFLSKHTPYKSLLLYHGLGTGKTCSAIGIAMEKIKYMISINQKRKIIIVCSPNIRENFKKQIFNEQKLNDINWMLNSCVGDDLMKIVNPSFSLKNKDKIKEKVNAFIDEWFIFMGYKGLSNSIKKSKQSNKLIDDFDDRLIIIDEIHNIRSENEEEKDKVILNNFQTMIEECNNIKLLLLSATPMFNNYSEIIWLINFININDNRPIVNHNDIFDSNGNFKIDLDTGEEIGKKKFIKKINGYVSFVQGNSPFTFPFRIYPSDFKRENSILNKPYPRLNWENQPISSNKRFIDYYCVELNEESYQKKIYNEFMNYINNGNIKYNFSNLKNLSLLNLLNIIYPSNKLIDSDKYSKQDVQYLISNNLGKKGLKQIFTNVNSLPFKYSDDKWKDTFKLSNLEKYSAKIFDICNVLKENKEGVSLIYSEKIYSGIIPMALALEEMGYSRLDRNHNLLSNNKKANLNYIVITGNKMLSKSNKHEIEEATHKNNKNGKNVKVILISLAGSEGIDFKFIRNAFIIDPWYNMNRIEQIIGRCIREGSHELLPFEKRNCCIYLYAVYIDNNNESIDMKLYRTAEDKDKVIGKISRVMKENSVDCLLYSKEKTIYSKGEISYNIPRNYLFNENDKLMTYYDGGNTLFPCEIVNVHDNGLVDVQFDYQIVYMNMPNNIKIQYMINQKPYSSECDYMKDCNYKCSFIDKENNIQYYSDNSKSDIDINTLNINNSLINLNNLKEIIINLFSEKYFYTKFEIIKRINFLDRQYSIEEIENALKLLINNKLNIILDRYNRKGNLINHGDLYIFQPMEIQNTNINVFERSYPLLINNDSLPIYSDDKTSKKITYKDDEVYDKFVNNINEKYQDIKDIMEIISKENQQLSTTFQSTNFKKIIIKMFFEKLNSDNKIHVLNYNIDNNITKNIVNDYIIRISKEPIIIIGYSKKDKLKIINFKDDIWSKVDDNTYYIAKLKEMYSNNNTIKSKPYYGINSVDDNDKSIFKIKSDKKSGNKGENCLTIKSEFNSIFESLLNIKYDTMSSLVKNSKNNLCFIIEFILRYKNEEKHENMTWFINQDKFCLEQII